MRAAEKYLYARSFPVHVGVDTAKKFHMLVARGPDGHRTKAQRVLVSRQGFDAADAHLTTLFPEITNTSSPKASRTIRFSGRTHRGEQES